MTEAGTNGTIKNVERVIKKPIYRRSNVGSDKHTNILKESQENDFKVLPNSVLQSGIDKLPENITSQDSGEKQKVQMFQSTIINGSPHSLTDKEITPSGNANTSMENGKSTPGQCEIQHTQSQVQLVKRLENIDKESVAARVANPTGDVSTMVEQSVKRKEVDELDMFVNYVGSELRQMQEYTNVFFVKKVTRNINRGIADAWEQIEKEAMMSTLSTSQSCVLNSTDI